MTDQLFTHVEIEINSDCNRSCWYCPNSSGPRPRGRMSRSTFETLLSQLKELRFSGTLTYQFYNEPLLSPDLEWFIKRSKEVLPETVSVIYTNGTLLTHERLKTLLESGADAFVVTRHESEKDYLFADTMLALNEEEKKRVSFQTHEDIRYTNRGGLITAGPVSIPELLPCFIPSFLLVITHEGNVLTCFEDFNEKSMMGNILEHSLKDIWDSPPYLKWRSDLRKGLRQLHSPCAKCNRTEVLPPSSKLPF